MRKRLIMLSALSLLAVCSNADVGQPSLNPTQISRVGGWYPVFFKTYDQNQVNQILENIKSGNIQAIKITYDQNSELATKIKSAIQSKTNMAIEVSQEKNIDTDTVQYNHDDVVVTIYQ